MTPTDYLKGRGIKLVPPAAKVIPAKAMRCLPVSNHDYPAMVLPFVREGGDGHLRFAGAHVTSLTIDGKPKLGRALDAPMGKA